MAILMVVALSVINIFGIKTGAMIQDVFTFARIIFKSPGLPAVMGWINDYPDSDLNLSFRLQQLSSLRVDPDGRVVKLRDPSLFDFPLIFAAHPGGMELSEEEAGMMRRYLLSGGVFFADDFWGSREWNRFEAQMKRVLPGRNWVELSMTNEIFHCVFDLKGPMNNLQVPSIHFWRRNQDPSNPRGRVSGFRGEGSDDMHVRAWLDDRNRIMIIATHNSDNGDGWEREGGLTKLFSILRRRTYRFPIFLFPVIFLQRNVIRGPPSLIATTIYGSERFLDFLNLYPIPSGGKLICHLLFFSRFRFSPGKFLRIVFPDWSMTGMPFQKISLYRIMKIT
jgi:hypothetical protein